jgi:uncharacterized protein YndB with AHSA1/START domain
MVNQFHTALLQRVVYNRNMAAQIIIEKTFDAPVAKVWEAWTSPEIVKKWWGPKDFTAPLIQIDFRVGGKYIYCMRGPAGSEWDRNLFSAGVYKEIVPMKKLVVTDFFSDENGNKVNPITQGMSSDMPEEITVEVRFDETGEGKTKLSIIYTPESVAQYDAMKKSGMEEGWSSSLDKLGEALKGM